MIHCESADFNMSRDIAKQISKNYDNIRSLLPDTTFHIGDSTITRHIDRTIFHLVTKQLYFHKPYYYNIQITLYSLKLQAQINNIFKIAFPKIASDLNEWPVIKN